MPTIDRYTVLVFDGRLRRATQKIAVLESAPGVDGVAIVKGGWVNMPQTVRTVTEATSATAAQALVDAYMALHGQIVTVVDQFSYTWTEVTVVRVDGVIASAGYSNKWRAEVSWTFVVPTIRPAGL